MKKRILSVIIISMFSCVALAGCENNSANLTNTTTESESDAVSSSSQSSLREEADNYASFYGCTFDKNALDSLESYFGDGEVRIN